MIITQYMTENEIKLFSIEEIANMQEEFKTSKEKSIGKAQEIMGYTIEHRDIN